MARRQVLLIAAIAAGALYLVGAAALGTPPAASDAPARVAGWVRDNRSGIRLAAWTATFGTLAFAVATAIVADALPQPQRRIFTIGATAFVVENAVQAWLWAAAALHVSGRPAATTQALVDVARYWGPLLTGTTITMIGAVTSLWRALPWWLRALGAIAFAEQAAETVTVFGTNGFTEPGGDMNLVLGAGLTAAWLAGLVAWAYARLGRRADRA